MEDGRAPSLASRKLDIRYTKIQKAGYYSYSVYKSLSILGQCPVNVNIPVPKLRALALGHKTNWWFRLKVTSNISD
jgi:hypothetical protein